MLCVHTLSVAYPDGTKAIARADFILKDGESVALVGANGAGKTTLLLALTGILKIAAGTVRLDDMELNKSTLHAFRQHIGLVFQNPDDQLFMPLIYDDIAFGPRNMGLPEEQVQTRVDGVLRRLHIDYLRDRSPLKLSGGEKRIAALATVLAMNPSVMLLDEPTAFLDPKARRELIRLLMELSHTKLIATHDLAFAAEVCSRVIVLKDGAIFEDGTPALLFDENKMDAAGLEAITR